MKTYIGPFAFDPIGECWIAPPGARTLIDLSPLSAPATRGVFEAESLPLDWEEFTGGDLTAMVWTELTDLADPDGLARAKPLVPTSELRLDLWLGGRRPHRRDKFRWGKHAHTNRLRDVIRASFGHHWNENQTVARKQLDFEAAKYGCDWKDLVPANLRAHVPGPLPHSTTITESFNKADSDTLGPDLTWTEIVGDLDVVSNEARTTDTIQFLVRADSDLSSTDHYCQVVMHATNDVSVNSGVVFRKDSTSGLTYYQGQAENSSDLWRFWKRISGSVTVLDTDYSVTFNASTNYTLKGQANGSTMTSWVDGVQKHNFTDTAVTTGTRCGLSGKNGTGGQYTAFDSFEAADVTAGGGTKAPLPYRRGSQRFFRGGW